MDRCEADHRIGKKEVFKICGKQYILCLQGRKWRGGRWVGSEYTESKPDHYWYEGFGSIVNLAIDQEVVFSFCTWEDRCGDDRSLHDFILISNYWGFSLSLQKKLPLVHSKLPELTDHLGEQLFHELCKHNYGDTQELFPQVDFTPLSYKELVNNGFIFDESGQIHIPI